MFGGFLGGGMQARVNRPFNEDYRCYATSRLPGPTRANVEYGGKGTATNLWGLTDISYPTSKCPR